MKKISLFSLLLCLLALHLQSCKSLFEAKRFASCEFRLMGLDNMQVAGVDVRGLRDLSQIGILEAGKITLAVAKGQLPVVFTLNMEVRNPNDKVASLSRLDWILLIDENEITQGSTVEKVEVQPGGVATLPLQFNLDFKQIFNKETGNSLVNLVLNLINQGKEDTRITAKIKPSFSIGKNGSISYPGYIRLSHEFKSK